MQEEKAHFVGWLLLIAGLFLMRMLPHKLPQLPRVYVLPNHSISAIYQVYMFLTQLLYLQTTG